MFSIRNYKGVCILRYVRLLNEYPVAPGPLRRMRRIVNRWIASHGQALPEAIMLNRWDPNSDAIYEAECSLWFGILRSFFWCIFRPVNLPDESQESVDWIRSVGLDVQAAGDIFLLQTHVTALLLNVPDANTMLRRRTISQLHPMFFSDPATALEEIFLSQSGSPQPALSSLQREVSGLFVLGNTFLTEWRGAWRLPREFFSAREGEAEVVLKGPQLFLVEALERRTGRRPMFYSLEFMVLFFLTFLKRFAERCPFPIEVHRAVLHMFLRDVVCRFRFSPTHDMMFLYWQAYLRITGSICAACNMSEWNFNQQPMSLQVINVGVGGTIYHCVPVVEECLLHSFSEAGNLSIEEEVGIIRSLYDESGRSNTDHNHALEANIGGMGDSLAWREWRILLPSIFSDVFSQMLSVEQALVHRPPSLQECVAWQTLQNNPIPRVDIDAIVSYLKTLTVVFFADYYGNECALGVLRNEEAQMVSLEHIQRAFGPRHVVLEQLLNFITHVELFRSPSSAEILRSCAMLEVILRGLPFCFMNRYRCILVFSAMEWCLDHLFSNCVNLQSNRRNLLSVDAASFSRVIWSWISVFAEEAIGQEDLDTFRDMFLRQFSILYTMHFAVERSSED